MDIGAVQRQDGLAALLGGHSGLAMVMGADEEIAKPMMDPVTVTLCENCALGEVNLAILALGD